MNNQSYPNYGPQMPPPYQPTGGNGAYPPNGGYPPNGAYPPNNGYPPNGGYPLNGGSPPYQSRNIQCGPDGVYRWVYEVPLMSNPVVFVTVFKALGITFAILALIFVIINLANGEGWEALLFMGKLMLIIGGIFIVLFLLSYLIFAAINGWKYVMIFEMGQEGILLRQLNRQVKRAKAIAMLAVIAGLAGGNRGAVSAGVLSATHQEMYCEFGSVRSVKPKRGWHTIKVREMLTHHQVYAADEDFDFVFQFILSHCPKAGLSARS